MALLNYIILIPCILSSLSCSIFLYFYIKYDSIRYTFGMKHVAILQSADLLVSLTDIFIRGLISINYTQCNVEGFASTFFCLFQTMWVALIVRYTYQVLYLKIDKERISILKPLIFVIGFSMANSILPVSLGCFNVENSECIFHCDKWIQISLICMQLFSIAFSFIISLYMNLLLIKKLRIYLKTRSNEMKWTFIRLSVYPFITIVCLIPTFVLFTYKLSNKSESSFLDLSSFICYNLIGFLNSVALGFTPEFREAIRFHRRQKTIPLIN